MQANPYNLGYGNTVATAPTNWSNLGSPLAQVNNSVEFSAGFEDVFSDQWTLTAQFQDNYQLTLAENSTPFVGQISSSAWMVQWHFSAFDSPISNVQVVSEPASPFNDAVSSFDTNDIWITYNHLYDYPSEGTYTLQIIPAAVPEPAAPALCVLCGLLACAALGRGGRLRLNLNPVNPVNPVS